MTRLNPENNIEEFMSSISDTIKKSKESAIDKLLSEFPLDDAIRRYAKAELVSRITYGMAVHSLQITMDTGTGREELIFKVIL